MTPVPRPDREDRLRFPNLVFIRETIHTRITISAKEDDPKRKEFGRVTEKVEVVNQRGECVWRASMC